MLWMLCAINKVIHFSSTLTSYQQQIPRIKGEGCSLLMEIPTRVSFNMFGHITFLETRTLENIKMSKSNFTGFFYFQTAVSIFDESAGLVLWRMSAGNKPHGVTKWVTAIRTHIHDLGAGGYNIFYKDLQGTERGVKLSSLAQESNIHKSS